VDGAEALLGVLEREQWFGMRCRQNGRNEGGARDSAPPSSARPRT
jgi:hypothetical protein